MVLDCFAAKLPLYYSSSRLTLLLTFLSIGDSYCLGTYLIPLPVRLSIVDRNTLGLHDAGGYVGECCWRIFQDFLDSDDPLALDERRYAVATLACLKILFGRSQPPVSRIIWFSQHSRALGVRMHDHSQLHHKGLPVRTYWVRSLAFYWRFRIHLQNQMPKKKDLYSKFELPVESKHEKEDSLAKHLTFLLRRSAYSDNILNFARSRVFRFGYLPRKHPTQMKKAIFALAKYIERVTGETAEVKACELVWGRDWWFLHNRFS